MSQTKKQSMVESVIQNVIGFLVGLLVQEGVFWWKGLEVNFLDNLHIGIIFAIVSIARSYLLRRVFNKQHLPSAIETVLHASNMQRDELIIELQEESIEKSILINDMQKYIHKNDGFCS